MFIVTEYAALIFKINISESVTGKTKKLFLQRYFHEESND